MTDVKQKKEDINAFERFKTKFKKNAFSSYKN